MNSVSERQLGVTNMPDSTPVTALGNGVSVVYIGGVLMFQYSGALLSNVYWYLHKSL
jgi:hypothetical protein